MIPAPPAREHTGHAFLALVTGQSLGYIGVAGNGAGNAKGIAAVHDHPNTVEQQTADLQKLLSASDLLSDIVLDICANIGRDKTHLLAAFSAAATTALHLNDDTVRDGLLVAWDIVNRTDAAAVFSLLA